MDTDYTVSYCHRPVEHFFRDCQVGHQLLMFGSGFSHLIIDPLDDLVCYRFWVQAKDGSLGFA